MGLLEVVEQALGDQADQEEAELGLLVEELEHDLLGHAVQLALADAHRGRGPVLVGGEQPNLAEHVAGVELDLNLLEADGAALEEVHAVAAVADLEQDVAVDVALALHERQQRLNLEVAARRVPDPCDQALRLGRSGGC